MGDLDIPPWYGERSGFTETWRIAAKAPCDDPVTVLRQLPEGRAYRLDEHRHDGAPRAWLSFGSDPTADLHLDDSTVSAVHGVIGRHRKTGHVFVLDGGSKNGVHVNGARMQSAILHPGDVVTVGQVALLACGRAGLEQQPTLTARTMDEFVHRAHATYGSQRRAVEAVAPGHSQQTFSRWLRGFFGGRQRRRKGA